MALSHYQLERVLAEITPRVLGGRVQKIHQPDTHTVELELYARGQEQLLVLRAGRGLGSLYLSGERTGPRGVAAPDFLMKLRAGLAGLTLAGIEQQPGDRIVRLAFAGPEQRVLVAELFSAGANCYLLDGENKIMAVLDPAAARGRENRSGEQFTPAPTAGTIPPPPAEDPLEQVRRERALADYNSAVRLHYEELAQRTGVEEEQGRLERELRKEEKRLRGLEELYRQNMARAGEARRLRENGEILSANYNSLRKGQDRVRLPDLFVRNRMQLRDITLDPALLPAENVERFFKQAHKLEGGAKVARERLAEVVFRLKKLDETRLRLQQAGREEQLEEVAVVVRPAPAVREKLELPPPPEPTEHKAYRIFTSGMGPGSWSARAAPTTMS